MTKFISAAAGALTIYSSFQYGSTFLLAILLLLEICSVINNFYFNEKWFASGMFAFVILNAFTDFAAFSLLPIVYLGIYLFVHKNINKWMSDSYINNFSYLIFAMSFPVFLTFITELYSIKWSTVTFALVYILFLRFSDIALTGKLSTVLFFVSQTFSLTLGISQLLPLPVNMVILLSGLAIWSLTKYNSVGGSFANVQRFFVGQVFRESR